MHAITVCQFICVTVSIASASFAVSGSNNPSAPSSLMILEPWEDGSGILLSCLEISTLQSCRRMGWDAVVPSRAEYSLVS